MFPLIFTGRAPVNAHCAHRLVSLTESLTTCVAISTASGALVRGGVDNIWTRDIEMFDTVRSRSVNVDLSVTSAVDFPDWSFRWVDNITGIVDDIELDTSRVVLWTTDWSLSCACKV